MTIATILVGKGHEVISVTAAHSVGEAVSLLAERRVGALPVMDGTQAVGIFSERVVFLAVLVLGVVAFVLAVGALSLMTRRRVRHLPVVENGRVIGLVSIGDLVKYRIDRIEADAEAMRTYI